MRSVLRKESAFYILVGSYLWKNLGYTMVLWLAVLRSIPEAILDAAKVGGAGLRYGIAWTGNFRYNGSVFGFYRRYGKGILKI